MYRQAVRHTLVPVCVLVLAFGLAPPPVVTAAGTTGPALPAEPAAEMAAEPAAEMAVPAVPAGDVASARLPAAAPAVVRAEAAPSPEPAGEVLDLTGGLDLGGGIELGPVRSPAQAPVAADVAAAVDTDGAAPVIIRLREQIDLAAVARQAARAGRDAAATSYREQHGAGGAAQLAQAAREADRAARGRVVVDSLQVTARDTQDSVRALLDTEASGVREFWIFNGFAATVDGAALDALAGHPDVASITLDQTIALPAPVEAGEPRLPEWSLENINAPDTWGGYGVRGADVVVGVMDTGADGGHPALAATWRGNGGGDPAASWFVPTGENYPEPGDGFGHGTHVTGSIVGAPPGEVTGVAPAAQWIAAKVFRDNGSTSDSVLHAGFEWMLAPGGDPAAAPDVVNNSWGSSETNRTEFWDDVAAWEAAGIVPVFANGNDGPTTGSVGSPASYPHAIGVGATHPDDLVAAFSSRGPVTWEGTTYTKPDLSAPGHAIRSTWPRSLDGDDYLVTSGTSMAAPHVTGVVALMLSAAPDLSVDEIRAGLTETTRVEPHMGDVPDNRYGTGIVDAYAAVTWAAHSGIVSGTVTGPDGEPVEATVTAGGARTATGAGTGGYALRVPAGTHQLTVAAPGYRARTVEVTVAVDTVVTVDVALETAPEHPLAGTVTGPGGPLPYARVALSGDPVVHTDQSGRFEMTVPEGEYDLRVIAAGHAPAVVPVVVDGPTDVTVSLEPLTGDAAPGWSQYQNNPARIGRSGDRLAGFALQPGWTASTGSALGFTSPVIAGGTVFIGSDAGRLSAFDAASGEPMWTFEASPGVRGAPAVAGSLVYTGGGVDGGIHALDATTGEPHWTVPTPGRAAVTTAPVVAGEVVYAATGPNPDVPDVVLALDTATGAQLWTAEIGPEVFGVAAADGIVVAASAADRRLVALDAATGEEIWSLAREDDAIVAAPSVVERAGEVGGGTVYATTTGPVLYQVLIDGVPVPVRAGSLLAVDAATGELLWENASHRDGQGTTPAVYHDLVIAGSHGGGKVVAYDRATGEPVWHYTVDGFVSASLLVSDDGYVFGGSQLDQRFWALDATIGELVWEEPAPRTVTTSAAYAGGRLVTADGGGTVRAFHPAGTVAGTVTGPDGPVPATVRAVEADVVVEADETGAFQIPDLVPGEHTLEVERYGFGPLTRTVEVVPGQIITVDIVLSVVGDGAVTGTVRDEALQPLPGATVTLSPTPLEPAVSDDGGGYGFDPVAAGTYQLVVDMPGYARVEETVTVSGGETTVVDVVLERFDIAVVTDFEGYITDGLTDAGWRADRITFDELVGNTDRYRAVVVAGSAEDPADADLDRLARIVAEADQAGTSVVFLGQWSLAHNAVRALSLATGDPAVAERGPIADRGRVWVEDVVPHPITASLPAGERVTLSENLPFAWFSGYTGYSLARLGTDRTGQVGDGIGYQPRTLDSAHILLPVHSPAPSARPDTHGWEEVMWDLLTDAVDFAASARYGEVTGQLTIAGGEPLAATVEVADGVGRAVAGEDGGYRLLLEPGEQTLRFRFPGAETVERQLTVVPGTTAEIDVQLPTASLGTLVGKVTDAGSGTPLAGATVTVPGLPPVTTGAGGRYWLEPVPGGGHAVTFTAEGYQDRVMAEVAVTEGEVTILDAALVRAPAVVVVGDRNGEITNFLEVHAIPAVEAGWEVTEDLDGVEVVVLNHPPNLDREEFLAALAAFDEAGVSVVFLAEGQATRTRGIDLLVRHTGDPPSFDGLGGLNGPPIYLNNLADHPIFDGVSGEPVQLLTGSSEAGHFPEYSGVTLAEIAEEGGEAAGIGMAYNPRTPRSIHLLLGGLTATFRNSPVENWTEDGQRIFLNAMRWAAAPGLGAFTGTVTSPGGAPIASATVEVVGTAWTAVTGPDGEFEIAVPPGTHTLRYTAFGYEAAERTLAVGADGTVDASVGLTAGEVGTVTGVVSSGAGGQLEGVRVALRGTPYQTLTGADGSYSFSRVEPGGYELEMETDGHVRTLAAVEVTAGGASVRDVTLRASPLVGIIDDSTSSNSRDRGKEFLADWGYQVEDIGFGDLERIAELDLVVANVANSSLELDLAGLRAFEEAVNRAGVPVVWLGQHNRGAIQFLHELDGDPAVVGEGVNDGAVTATAVEDHPLVAGLPDEFALIAENGRYTFFDEFGGTTVATLATGDGGEQGATIAYRGRTAGTVDVLLSTLTVSLYGAPSTRQSPALNWTPGAERVLVNALDWALDAEGIGAEVRGTVRGGLGELVPSRVEVRETGRTYQGRAGDGTFLVPLPAGTWTLDVSSFGHEPTTVEVTVEAGDSLPLPVTLTALPAGTVTGTVTGPDGSPIPDAGVGLVGTPLAAATGPDGGYTVAGVPAGDWTVRVTADGFRTAQVPVTVTAGQSTVASAQLRETAAVAIVDNTGSSVNGTALADLIADGGYQVELVDRDDLAELAGRIGDFDLVIFNSTFINAAQREAFGQAADAADGAGVSVIFAGQYGDYSLHQLAVQRSDPEVVTNTNVTVGIDLVPGAPHPIFAGYPVGEPIELITSDASNLNQRLSFYSGYSGQTLATVHARVDGAELGDAVGYRFSSPTSVELLLASMATSTVDGYPSWRWTADAERIYLNAVAWAIDATQAELTGLVTGSGEALAGATVTAVEAGVSTVTGSDGSYVLGLAAGTHTIRVSAFGFAPATQVVEVPESGTVTLDVDVVPLPRGEVTGRVTSVDGAPVAGASVAGAGPVAWTATTGEDGRYAAGDLLEGEYQVTVTADAYLPGTGSVTVEAGQPAVLDVTLQPTDVGVLGDVDGALTSYLVGAGVPATELAWSADVDLTPFEVVVVNGGDPDAATFEAVLAAADAAEVSLVFTGTWAVDRGGIRLLERYTDRVQVGAQGYGDGPVQLTGFGEACEPDQIRCDPAHSLFAGLDDPATLIVDGGYYSVLDSYTGAPLADLRVARDGGEAVTGLAVGWDWRTAGSLEVLLSASAVTEAVGPGLGWTPEGGQLVVNAIAWAREAVLAQPPAPTLVPDTPVVVTETVSVAGESVWPATVTVLRDGEPVATMEAALDGTWAAEVPLAVGDNVLTAVASNLAGASPASPPVTVARWAPQWEVRGTWPVHVVVLRLDGVPRWTDPAQRAELVVSGSDGEVARFDLTWINGFYLVTLRGLDPDEYTLRAELLVDGHPLVLDGPMIG